MPVYRRLRLRLWRQGRDLGRRQFRHRLDDAGLGRTADALADLQIPVQRRADRVRTAERGDQARAGAAQRITFIAQIQPEIMISPDADIDRALVRGAPVFELADEKTLIAMRRAAPRAAPRLAPPSSRDPQMQAEIQFRIAIAVSCCRISGQHHITKRSAIQKATPDRIRERPLPRDIAVQRQSRCRLARDSQFCRSSVRKAAFR